ncbi:MAG: hypothetical protein ACOYKP_07200 [Polynucleobacter sp.]
MNPNESNSVVGKMRMGLAQIKAALTKDYSWQDITAWLSNKRAHASSVNIDPNTKRGSADRRAPRLSNLPMTLAAVAGRHHMLLAALLCIGLFAVASQIWLLPLTKTMQAQLDLRPVQWAQLQHLVRVNQLTSTTGVGASSMAASGSRATLTNPLNESEIQKVRAVLAARDIKPNVLRLSNDNPPRLEFQANDVLFSAWIEVLDELRQVWRLYPETASVIASANPGIVQVSSSLKQMQLPQQSQAQSPPQSVLPKAP